MIDGKYDCKTNIPGMGEIKGKIILTTNGNTLEGIIETMGMRNKFTGGKLQGNTCRFQGKWNTLMGIIEYDIIGKVVGNELEIKANTNKGNFIIKGTKIA